MGLLDFLEDPKNQLGIGLLAAAGPSAQPMGFGQRLAGALQYADASKKQRADREQEQYKFELLKQQIAQGNRKDALMNNLLSQLGGQPANVSNGQPGQQMPQGGMPQGPQGQMSVTPQGGGLLGRLDPDKLAALKLGAGVDLTDVWKLNQPDMQVNNGYAYDKRTVQPGYLPQMNISQNGQASMVQIGRDGQPVVSAPRGALETFGAYQRAQEGTKADFDLTTVTPQGQNPQMTTRGNLVRNSMVGNRVSPEDQRARDTDRMGILQAELATAKQRLNQALGSGDQSAAARAQEDMAALSREMGRSAPSVGMPLQSDEEKLRAQRGVEGDAKRNTDVAGAADKSRDFLKLTGRARELLADDPTASGTGALVDVVGNFFGKSSKSADNAAALENIGGSLTSNVPRMEGPQGVLDVKLYEKMAGMVGDRTIPVSQRLAALTEVERLQSKYANVNGGVTGREPAKPAGSQPMNALPTANSSNKGRRARELGTGRIYESNGMQWKEVQ